MRMFHVEDVLQLKDGEKMKTIVRRHPVTFVPGLGAALLLIVLPFFFLFPLFSWGAIGFAVFILAVVGGIIWAIRTLLLWDADVLIVSTLRLVDVDQKGIFSRFVTEVPFASIQDASWQRHGMIDTLFRVGTLSIQTGATTTMTVRRVAHPELLHELINDLRHATTPQKKNVTPEQRERLRSLTELLERLSPQALNRIEDTIRKVGREEAVSAFLTEDEKSSA